MKLYLPIALCFLFIGLKAQYTYELQPHYECGYDALIKQNELFAVTDLEPDTAHWFNAEAWTWKGDSSITRSYINFPDLKYLLPYAENVESASLKLFMMVAKDTLEIPGYETGKYYPHQTRGYCNLTRFSRITEHWGQDISWENQPSLAEGDLFSDYVEGWENECDCPVPLCNAYEHIEVDLTEMTKWWQQNASQLFGVQFRLVEEFVYNRKCFTSSNSDYPDEHPIFTLETSNELRFINPVYYINQGETLILSAPIDNATYYLNGENVDNGFFVFNETGYYDISITLPNCFTLRNKFEIRHKIASPISFPITTTELEAELAEETFKPVKGKPSSNGKVSTFMLFDANGTLIFTTQKVPKDIYALKAELNLDKGLYLYKTVEQDVVRNTVISKSGKFYNL